MNPNTTSEPPCSPQDSDISWMLVATVLVLGMLPGLSFFEAGLLRGKNTISITIQVFTGTAVLCTMWIAFGYSLSFSGDLGGKGFIGDFANIGFMEVRYDDCYTGTDIPTALYALFQMMFAAITPLLMTGAFAERLAWKPFILMMITWEIIVYYPVAHWMWSPNGWLYKMGAQDFAGGIVIHITAGISALISVIILGQRYDYAKHHGEAPYSSLPIACIGASLLWTGWFGFNGGSALTLQKKGLAIHAVMNSQIAASICSCCFLAVSMRRNGRPSMIAVINGAIGGLAGITPCAGYVTLGWGILLAVVLAVTAHISIYFVKHKWQIDDALEVSCVHGVPGLVGAIWTGFFASSKVGGSGDGLVYGGGGKLLGVQLLACLVCGVWAAVWTVIIMKTINYWIPLRVSAAVEKAGLDLLEHNEVAWLADKVSPNTSFAIVPLRSSGHVQRASGGAHDTRSSTHTTHSDNMGLTAAQSDALNDIIRQRAIVLVESDGNKMEELPMDPDTDLRASRASSGTSRSAVVRVRREGPVDDSEYMHGGYS